MKHQGGKPLATESPLVPREHPLASLKYIIRFTTF